MENTQPERVWNANNCIVAAFADGKQMLTAIDTPETRAYLERNGYERSPDMHVPNSNDGGAHVLAISGLRETLLGLN